MSFDKEKWFELIHQTPGEVHPKDSIELGYLLNSPAFVKACQCIIENQRKVASQILSFDLSEERSRYNATRLQGRAAGQITALEALADLATQTTEDEDGNQEGREDSVRDA